MFPKWQAEVNGFDFASGNTSSSQLVINSQEISSVLSVIGLSLLLIPCQPLGAVPLVLQSLE